MTEKKHPRNEQSPLTASTEYAGIQWPYTLRREIPICKICDEQARLGNRLMITELYDLDFVAQLGEIGEFGWATQNLYINNIRRYNNDALAHIALPFSYQILLFKAKIETISSLQAAIEENKLQAIPGIGFTIATRIEHLLNRWKKLPDLIKEAKLHTEKNYSPHNPH
jgi:hypothetical protein